MLNNLELQYKNYFIRLIELAKHFFSKLLKVKSIELPLKIKVSTCAGIDVPNYD